jgi:hypothetical protein
MEECDTANDPERGNQILYPTALVVCGGMVIYPRNIFLNIPFDGCTQFISSIALGGRQYIMLETQITLL